MNNTKKHNRKDSRHKLKNKRRIKQSNKKRITKRVTKKNRKTFRGGEKMDPSIIKRRLETIAEGGEDGVEGPFALKTVEFKTNNLTICNVYRFTQKSNNKIIYILTDFENIKPALFYEIIFNFCFALAIPLDIAWVITAFIILGVGINTGLIHIIVFITELAINAVIFLATRRIHGMPGMSALVKQEKFKVPSITNLLTNFKEYNKNDRDVHTIKALICKLKNYFTANSLMEIKEKDFDEITFTEKEMDNFFEVLYPSVSKKIVLFLAEKDDGSGVGIGYIDLNNVTSNSFIFTDINMSSIDLNTLNDFFTDQDKFHLDLAARFNALKNNNGKNIDEDKFVNAIGDPNEFVNLVRETDKTKEEFFQRILDSGAFDNVKLDLYAPKRIGETNSVRPHVSQQQIETMSYNPYIVNRANAAKSRLINAGSRLGTPFPPAPPQSIRFSPRQSMLPQQSMPPPPPV
jgi:hypothetical protein